MTTTNLTPSIVKVPKEAEDYFEQIRAALLTGQEVQLPGIGLVKLEGRGVRGGKGREGGFKPVLIATFDELFKREALAGIDSGVLPTNRSAT